MPRQVPPDGDGTGSIVDRTCEALPRDDELEDEPPSPPPRSLTSLPRAMRPRERLLAGGVATLTAAELLAVVIGSGTAKQSSLRLAERLVRTHGLRGLAALEPAAWRLQPGLGMAMASRLCAAFELGRRAGAGPRDARPTITRPRQVWNQVRGLARARKEHLVGLYLDAQNGLLHRETVSIGSLNTTRTHPREILYPAIVHMALGFILVHNHPSGSLDPSQEDVDFTHAVRRASELMGIDLYDHIIVSRDGYTSMRERGLI